MTKDPDRLLAYALDDLPPSEVASVEAELAASPEARRTVDEVRAITSALASPEPELEALDLASAVRAQAARPAKPPRRWLRWTGALAAAASVALAIGVVSFRDRVREKGSVTNDAQRWAGVRLFRTVGEGPPQPLAATIGRSDGILVSYSNLGPRPFSHLMVFTVDARREVSWLYPAWQRPTDDPESVPLSPGATVELRERVTPTWSAGRSTIYALFTHEPHRVREIEALLARGEPALEGALVQRFEVTVTP